MGRQIRLPCRHAHLPAPLPAVGPCVAGAAATPLCVAGARARARALALAVPQGCVMEAPPLHQSLGPRSGHLAARGRPELGQGARMQAHHDRSAAPRRQACAPAELLGCCVYMHARCAVPANAREQGVGGFPVTVAVISPRASSQGTSGDAARTRVPQPVSPHRHARYVLPRAAGLRFFRRSSLRMRECACAERRSASPACVGVRCRLAPALAFHEPRRSSPLSSVDGVATSARARWWLVGLRAGVRLRHLASPDGWRNQPGSLLACGLSMSAVAARR
jgi:hypothetical protein